MSSAKKKSEIIIPFIMVRGSVHITQELICNWHHVQVIARIY